MAYIVESDKVRYAGKVVRGADAATFDVLGGAETWGRDGKQVYYAGQKVTGAKPATFVAFSDDVGADARKIFYRLSMHQKPSSAVKPKGMGDDVEVLRDDEQLVLKSSGAAYAAAPSGIGAALPVDADSFELAGRGYARDAQGIYWFRRRDEAVPVPDADLATFTVVGGIASDKQGRFLNGQRDDVTLPIEEAELPEALVQTLGEVVTLLLPRYFELFDRMLPNDDVAGLATVGRLTEVPECSIALDGPDLTVTAKLAGGDRSCVGRTSCLELLAAEVYSAVRGEELAGTLSLRVLPKACKWPTVQSDEIPLWHRQLDLVYLLEKAGEHDESRLLLAQAMREQRACPRTGDLATDPRLRAEKLVPDVLVGLPGPVAAQGSTTQAAMKWIIKQGLHTSPDSVVRRSVADEVLAMVRSTSGEPVRFAGLGAPLLGMLQDSEPAVRARAAIAFDLLASKLFYFQAYEAAQSMAAALAEGGFNLDIQLARQWECFAAVGRDEEAERAWEGALALNQHGGRAPRQHTGLHMDYPSLEVWRAFGELRLVEAHGWAAKAEHPSKELRKKKQALEANDADPATWIARAKERAANATQTMERLALDAPAAEIGLCLAEFAEGLAKVTDVGRVDGAGFVMHSQYVDFRRYGVPYTADAGAIEFTGEFESTGGGQFRALAEGTAIPCELGRAFGIEYRFAGGPLGRRLPGSVRVERPTLGGKVRVDDYPILVYLGLRENFVFLLESPEELAAGEWTFTITLFSAAPPSDYPCRGELVPDSPLATLQQTFELAAQA